MSLPVTAGQAGGIAATIPQPCDQQAQRRRSCINRLKQWRGLAMRTDKLAVHYQAALTVAGILLWTKP